MEQLFEILHRSDHVRLHDVHHGEHVERRILHRRAGERDDDGVAVRVQALHGGRALRRIVLELMHLVDDHEIDLHVGFAHLFDVCRQDVKGHRQHNHFRCVQVIVQFFQRVVEERALRALLEQHHVGKEPFGELVLPAFEQ